MHDSSPPILEARHVGRRRADGSRWLLDDISLEVRPRERLGVVGPSGAGKTLLLRAISLLDPLDRGEIHWRGQPVHRNRVPAFRAQAIYLHQRPAMTGETIEAALRHPLALKTHGQQPFRRDWVVARLEDLGRDASFLDKRVRDLSGGESQIVSLLRALQLDPTLLMLDEPTAAMDPDATRAVESLIERWIGDGHEARAFLWVSHDEAQIGRVARRIVSIQAGKLVPSPLGRRLG